MKKWPHLTWKCPQNFHSVCQWTQVSWTFYEKTIYRGTWRTRNLAPSWRRLIRDSAALSVGNMQRISEWYFQGIRYASPAPVWSAEAWRCPFIVQRNSPRYVTEVRYNPNWGPWERGSAPGSYSWPFGPQAATNIGRVHHH
jgi:hypothetical protein